MHPKSIAAVPVYEPARTPWPDFPPQGDIFHQTETSQKAGFQNELSSTATPHILRLFLDPDDRRFIGKAFKRRAKRLIRPRIKLLDPQYRDILSFEFFPPLRQVVENLSRTKQYATNLS